MSDYQKKEDRLIKKLAEKFNGAGIYGLWAENAARRVLQLVKEGSELQEAVYKVYREL